MSQINFHPAPGLGELMPGWFVVPQNPIAPDRTELMPTPQARSGGRPVYVPHVGELMPAKFTVPQNPLVRELRGLGVLGGCGSCGMAGCAGCGSASGEAKCGAGCGCASAIGFSGLGSFGDSLSGLADTLTTGYMPYLIGGGLLLLFLSGRGSSREGYRKAVDEAGRRYPSRYRRVRRAMAAY